MYLPALSRPQPICFAVGFPLPHRDCCLVDLSFQKVWGSPCSCVDWDNGVGAFERKKKAAENSFSSNSTCGNFSNLIDTLILVVTTISTIGKGENPTYRTIQANKARNVASSILGPWCGIGCFVGGSTAEVPKKAFLVVAGQIAFYSMWTMNILIFFHLFLQWMTSSQRFFTEKKSFYSALII